jgi:ketosteroid isomerase-like protein
MTGETSGDRDDVGLVRAWLTASQGARGTGSAEDFEALHRFLHPEIEILLASGWADDPWRVAHRGADSVVARLQEAINSASSLSTETVNVAAAGDDVLVEQLSVLEGPFGPRRTMIAHIFTVVDGQIVRIRSYRNDANLPG